jgi:Carboxypeptidase regulatory-like domain/TonB-dependent Receptor Plug Domain
MLAKCSKSRAATLLVILYLALGLSVYAQSGNSTSITGTVLDQTGAVVTNATVEIQNPVSGFSRTATTDNEGKFTIPNVPFNPYHLTVIGEGFADYVQDVDARSAVAVNLTINMKVPESSASVTVEASAEDLLENTPTFHVDLDRDMIEKVPLESASSSVSSLVTLVTPGVSADSNGLFHGLGDHAENQFVVDGQAITDQQSKVFSNQIPEESIQSMEVISGAPPAEYGGKTSLVIDVTTRSGQGATTPHGSVTAEYGSFGSSNGGFDVSYGGKNWGNFIAAGGLNTGRFLDPPEFTVMHDKGNEENIFDRVDYQLSAKDSIHSNFQFTRSWFQTPNSFDQQNATAWSGAVVNNGGLGPNGLPVGPADQRSQIKTINIAPAWTHLLGGTTLFTVGAFVRRDSYNYYPSSNPFADLSPDLQSETVGQHRTLLNTGVRSNFSYVKGIHNLKAGASYEQTLLDEHDVLGIVDPTLNMPSSPNFNPLLAPYDLTRGGGLFTFNGHTDVKELALYVQDAITKGNWNFNLGIRGDLYNGLTTHREAEPRLGIAYNIKPSKTVLRVSYARTMESPFNENLVLSSVGCANAALNPLLLCSSPALSILTPGWRNEFHAGFQQALGKYMVFSGEYIWKYTHHGFDFSVLGNTPITFPVEWDRSKIPGYAGRLSVPNVHGFSALVVFSSVAARFFTPQVGGAGATPSGFAGVFRIDHDEKFNETTHIQYQPWKRGPWMGFNWRYDSGQVAGATPCYNTLTVTCAGSSTTLNGQPAVAMINTITGKPLSADQEFQAGFTCAGMRATPTQALPSVCLASQFGSSLIKVPAPGTENDEHNPQRIQARNLFDLSIGDDNLFRADKYKWSAQFTVINLGNSYSLYNFLSTFSGTHYVTPRSYTAQMGFHF